MRQIRELSSALPIFKCLGSDIRIAILELLSEHGSMPMKDISEKLGISNGSLTPHIRMLSDNNLISIQFETGKHGVQRICSLCEDRLIIDFENSVSTKNIYESEIGVGQYTDYSILPTCGISTTDHVIGTEDDPRFFGSPERIHAGILWFSRGYVEYILPNFLESDQVPVELLIAIEIASEAPGTREDWPSDIVFSINGTELCSWMSPGDFGSNPGIYNPDWWDPNWNQYGQLKFLSVTENGTYIDGVKRSDITLHDLNITDGALIRLRIASVETGGNCGGLTLYGRGFGNYDQDIIVRMQYRQL